MGGQARPLGPSPRPAPIAALVEWTARNHHRRTTTTIKEAVLAALDEWAQQARDEDEGVDRYTVEDAWRPTIDDLVSEAVEEWCEANKIDAE